MEPKIEVRIDLREIIGNMSTDEVKELLEFIKDHVEEQEI